MTNMTKIKCLTAFLCALSVGALNAADPWIEFEGRHWDADFESDIKVVRNNIGQEVDLSKDLNVDDDKVEEGILTLHTGERSKIRFSYFDIDLDGSQAVTKTLSFQGINYTVGTTVNSSMEISYGRFDWLYYFGDSKAKFRMGTIVGLKYLHLDIALEVPAATNLNQDEDATGGLPVLGFVTELRPVKNLVVYTDVNGLTDDDKARFLEAEAGVKYTLFDNVIVSGGYRLIDLKVEDDPDYFELELEGVFLGAGIQF